MLQHETSPQTAPLRPVFQQDVPISSDALETAPTQAISDTAEQTQNPSAVHLTAQEFARATVEAETQPLSRQAARRVSGLGEQRPRTTFTDGAGHALTIDAAAQELLAEVQAYRAVKHRSIAMSPFRRKELSWWLLLGGFLASSAAALGITFLCFALLRNNSEIQTAYIKQEQKLANLEQAQRNASALRPLSQFADNQVVYARYTDLIALANGTSPNQIFVADTQGYALSGSPQWMLLKSNGVYVVRGWRWPQSHTATYKVHQNDLSSTQWQSDEILEPNDFPITFFHNRVLLPNTTGRSTGAGEVVQLPDAP